MSLEDSEKQWRATPRPIASIYRTETPNAPILLHKGQGTIWSNNDLEVSGEFELLFRWVPSTSVTAKIPAPSKSPGIVGMGLMFGGLCTFEMDGLSQPAKVWVSSASKSGYEAIVNGEWFPERPDQIASLCFHLCNLPLIHGRPVAYESATSRGYHYIRTMLEADGWTLTIDAVDHLSVLQKALAREGGNAITHVGRLVRTDGSMFNPSNGETVITPLHWFIGFCFAAWCGPLLLVGYDRAGSIVLRDFGPRHCSRFRKCRGWCAHADGSNLETLWPLFYDRWKDSKWQPILRRAIWWYVSSENPELGRDASLILTQAGLELLAWTRVVDDRKLISGKSFDLLPTADKIRMLLGSFDQPFTFYTKHRALEALATKKQWMVAPWAMTEVRNRLVHPKNASDLDAQSDAIVEASELALHYLELSILFLLDYRGPYTNRITCEWRGTTEPVPWAAKDVP